MNMDFMRYVAYMGEGKAKVGDSIPIDYKDPDNAKNTAKGTVKIESLDNGVAKLIGDLAVTNEQTTTPMKMKMTSWFDTGLHKATKIVGKITDLPSQGGMTFDSMDLTMERIK
jgi:hypothetical protein